MEEGADDQVQVSPQRWALVVRVLSARNVGHGASEARRSKLALRVSFGQSVKRSSFEDVVNGRVRWGEELVFMVADPAADAVMELTNERSSSSSAFSSSSVKGGRGVTYIAAKAFADIGSDHHSGWFPLQSKEEVKLSLFWRAITDETGDVAEAPKKATSPSLRKMLLGGGGGSRTGSGTELGVSGAKKILLPVDIIYSLDSDSSALVVHKAKLKLVIHAARGLRSVNLGGKSDPFAVVAIHGSRRKTRTMKNTLDPVWTADNSFTFGEVEDLDNDDELQIVLKDWDPFGRYKDLGQLVVTLRHVQEMTRRDGAITSRWFNLAPTIYMSDRTQLSDLGSVQLSIAYSPKEKQASTPATVGSPTPHRVASPPMTPPPPVRGPSSGPVSPTAVQLQPSGASSGDAPLSTTSEKPKLYVRLVQARNLFASDFGGVSDPYVVLKCKSETKRTVTCTKTLTPAYDFEAVFGDKDYIQENDELVVRVFDQDSTISSIVDDELGSVRIPMWSLLLDDAVSMEAAMTRPRWYSLEPFNSKQKCAGEVQLALYYSNPAAKKKDIYKGKVWLFELQATVITARNLGSMSVDPNARIKPYCTIACGRMDRWKTNVASNGVNPTWSERFRFRRSADVNSERDGILKTDVLKVAVYNSVTAECLGRIAIDVSFIMDKLGYLDLQGKAFTAWFDLIPAGRDEAAEDSEGIEDDEEEDGLLEDADDTTTATADSSQVSLATVRSHALKLGTVFKKRLTGSSSRKSSASPVPSLPSTDTPKQPLPSADEATAAGSLLPPADGLAALDDSGKPGSVEDKLRKTPQGQIRLTLRLVPIGETRMKNKKKLAVYVNEARVTSSSSSNNATGEVLPPLIYLKCRVGSDAIASPPVPSYCNVDGGRPRFHTLFGFEDEIDWMLDAAARRKVALDKKLRQYRHMTGGDAQRARELLLRNETASPQDSIVLSVHDASTDQTLCEASTTFMDALLGKKLLETESVALEASGRTSMTIDAALKIVDIKEEMIPLLGHIYARLVSYKSTLAPRLDHSLRFVIRYGDRVVASKAISGDPFPDLLALFGNDPFRFPVYNAFKSLVVEVWQNRTSGVANELGDGNQAMALAKSVLSVFKRSDSTGSEAPSSSSEGRNDSSSTAKSASSKWGTLLGTATLTLFDLVELEAQTVFEEDYMTRGAPEKAFKIRVRDKAGREIGALWMEGRYTENVGGVLSPNPNPPTQAGKPFSLANFRHEVNRLVKVVGWLGAFGAHVGALLNWESPSKTVSTIVAICVVCSVDWFSSRWLLVFPFCLLIHMINRHRLRTNGMLLSEFEDSEEGEEGLSAEVRVACLSAKQADPRVARAWRKVHAQVSLLSRPGKPAKVIGLTKVDSRLENGDVDFSSSKMGYSIRPSVKARPAIQMWKYSESLPPVPSFNFRVENFTVLKDTILVVTLFNAKRLISADANGLSDPFAKIFIKDAVTGQVAGDVTRSSVRFKTLNPVWNERFVLGEKKAVVASNILVLNFFDSDVIATSNDPLGNLEIDLSQLSAIFPPRQDAARLSQEERAIRGRRWFPLAAPKGVKKPAQQKESNGDTAPFGEVCIHVEWMDIPSRSDEPSPGAGKLPLAARAGPSQDAQGEDPVGAEEADEENNEEELPLDSWTRCGAGIAVDLFDQRDAFLGRALVPLGSVVSSDETRVQPQVELELPLLPKYDGSKDDARYGEDLVEGADQDLPRGTVRVRMMVTLPDPKAKERRMAMMEAKRADRSSAFQKMRMITKHLERLQGQLAAVNSRAERMKNLFNWTHPRRTKLMFNLMLFLSFLFILIPSRFFILMVVLFFFTEKFRPLGTMGARFKHLLSQLPTDDDLRAVVGGDAIGGKRKLLTVNQPPSSPSNKRAAFRRNASNSAPTGSSRALTRASSDRGPGIRDSTAGDKGAPLTKKELAVKLQNICATDALFSGHLSFAKLPKQAEDARSGPIPARSLDFSRKFFVVSTAGLHYWSDREALESSRALGHMVQITDVISTGLPNVAGFTRHECAFMVESDRDRFLFVASSEAKKGAWIHAIRHHASIVA